MVRSARNTASILGFVLELGVSTTQRYSLKDLQVFKDYRSLVIQNSINKCVEISFKVCLPTGDKIETLQV